MDKNTYKHCIVEKVRFHEVDMLAVCNNAVYFNYFEDARIKYVQDIQANYKLKELLHGDSFFIMARNECNYIEPAFLDDELKVYTKISFIKNTSFGFKHIIEKVSTGKIISEGGGVVVHINKKTNTKVPLPQEFYDAVTDYDKDVELLNT